MNDFQVGDIVRHMDGGVTGEIVILSGGKAFVKFTGYTTEIELQYLVLMGRKNR